MQSFEKWIEEKKHENEYTGSELINVSDLFELLKTHVIVPRKPTLKMIEAGRHARKTLSTVTQTYATMIEAGENE